MAMMKRAGGVFMLLTIISSTLSQECTSARNNQLLYSESGSIYEMDINGGNRKLLANSPMAISMDYDYRRRTLYWSDAQTRRVYALKDESSQPQVAISEKTNWLPFSIAVDSITNKLYVGDSVTGTVRVVDLNNGNEAIVLRSNLSTEVKSLAMDLQEGYLFVLDKYRIIRADMDGASHQVIYSEKMNVYDSLDNFPLFGIFGNPIAKEPQTDKPLDITSITIDTKSKRVLWVNTATRTVESLDYFGNDKKYHSKYIGGIQTPERLGSITLLNGNLYWVSDVNQELLKVDANKKGNNQVLLKNVTALSIKGISCPSQWEIRNPCEENNGQCQHLCLSSRSNKSNYRCACKIGYELTKNGKSCASVEEFLLFTESQSLRGRRLNPHQKGSIDVIDSSKSEIGSGASLDYDAAQGLIYYSSLFPKDQLHQLRVNTGDDTTLLPDLLSEHVGRLAFDWASRNLYYFTYYYANMKSLSIVNIDDPTYSKILIADEPKLVTGIAVHPNRGYVYYSQVSGTRGQISRMATDGSDLRVVVDLVPIDSIGLAVDYQEDRLYWTKSKETRNEKWNVEINHSNLDGQDVKRLPLIRDTYLPNEMKIHENYIYIIGDENLVRYNKRDLSERVVIAKSKEPALMSGLQIYSHKVQTVTANHPCGSGHKCQKFCFAVPESSGILRGICSCPYGEKLAEDGRSCVDNRAREPPFMPCQYKSFRCNKQLATA